MIRLLIDENLPPALATKLGCPCLPVTVLGEQPTDRCIWDYGRREGWTLLTKDADLRVIGDWPAIIGFRNILAHAYEQVEDAVVWGIVTEQLPRFLAELEAIPDLDSLTAP